MHPGSGGCSFAKLTPHHHHLKAAMNRVGGHHVWRGDRSPPPHTTCCSPPGQAAWGTVSGATEASAVGVSKPSPEAAGMGIISGLPIEFMSQVGGRVTSPRTHTCSRT